MRKVFLSIILIAAISCTAQKKEATAVKDSSGNLVGIAHKENFLQEPYNIWFTPNYKEYTANEATIKKLKPNSKTELGTISYGKHLSLMGVIGLVAGQIDKILIFHFLGAAELAIYSIAIAPPEQIKALLKNIKNLALPKFSEKSISEIKKTIYQKMAKLFLILIFIVGIYWFIAPYIFKMFFPQYLESLFYSQIFYF
jgi:O-antigen/teichoic acid export membrane protein